MAALRDGQVAENREALVDGVDKPKTGSFLGRISCSALSSSAARPRERGAFFVKDVHERSRNHKKAFARADLQARRDIARIINKSAGAIAQDSPDRERNQPARVLRFDRK